MLAGTIVVDGEEARPDTSESAWSVEDQQGSGAVAGTSDWWGAAMFDGGDEDLLVGAGGVDWARAGRRDRAVE